MNARSAILALLEKRGPGKTICPSEAARHLASLAGEEEWRERMASVHEAVEALHGEGAITLSWRGEKLDERRGAYRIARGE